MSAHCLLAAFPASGVLRCWSLENCTGPERDRPRRHVLICRFGASPSEPQPSIAATNKCLARNNKSHTGRKLQRSGDGAAQFRAPPTGETRCGVSVAGLYHPLTVRYRGKEQKCERERSCADPRMLRFGVCATRVRDQGQRQFQRPAHPPRTGTAPLRQIKGARSHRCRLAKSEGLTLRNVSAPATIFLEIFSTCRRSPRTARACCGSRN